jgi:hypothetical protein
MQTRLHSIAEQVLNVGTGFVISLLLWEFLIKPVWNIQADLVDNLQITSLFTVVSIARGYIFRRLANRITVRQQKQKENDHAATYRTDWKG